jgi:mono/diheme cytochrome c family protein
MGKRVLAVVAGLMVFAGSALAGDEATLKAAGQGRAVFAANCASCHGNDARGGSGPDLTTIGARNGGFERLRVASLIDGRRDGLKGGPMPSWCQGLQHSWPYGPSAVALKTHTLVRYLESVQAEAPAPLQADATPKR